MMNLDEIWEVSEQTKNLPSKELSELELNKLYKITYMQFVDKTIDNKVIADIDNCFTVILPNLMCDYLAMPENFYRFTQMKARCDEFRLALKSLTGQPEGIKIFELYPLDLSELNSLYDEKVVTPMKEQSDLVVGKFYDVANIKYVNTSVGRQIYIQIRDSFDLYLPEQMNKFFRREHQHCSTNFMGLHPEDRMFMDNAVELTRMNALKVRTLGGDPPNWEIKFG